MHKEIERKWLIDDMSDIPDDAQWGDIWSVIQGYLLVKEDAEIRFRRMKNYRDDLMQYFMTAKFGSGIVRDESPRVRITKEEFDRFYGAAVGVLHKRSMDVIDKGGYEIKVDDYHDHGLIIAEIEFHNIEEANAFVPYDWFGREVTHDLNYYAKNIAVS